MKTRIHYVLITLALLSTLNFQLSTVFAQGTAFTYQGRLNSGTNPATGHFDIRFAIYDAATAGTRQGSLLTNSATVVSNGLFTVMLDFGNQFPGANRWLEIGVRTNGTGTFSTLSPRQALTPAPYAITAANVTGLVPDSGLSANVARLNASQTFTGVNTFNNSVSVNNLTPTSTLTVAGDIQMAGGAAYHNLQLSGGNSAGFLYGAYNPLGDGIHLGYNFYYDAGGNPVVPNAGGGTSRITVGYDSIVMATGGINSAPVGRVYINSGGGVGIGTSNPQGTLDVDGGLLVNDIYDNGDLSVVGNAYKTGGGTWSFLSDARLKKNIQPLTGVLDKLLELHGVSFEFKEPEKIHELSGERIGMIAQEVEGVFPDWVSTGKDSYKRLTYRGFEALTVEALRELRQEKDTKIAELEKTNTEMQKELAGQRELNDRLEARLAGLEQEVARIAEKSDPTFADNRETPGNKP